jgi:hypothetical protein
MRTFLLTTLAVSLTGGIAHANLLYQFSVNASSPLDAFSFSFTAPAFVGDGDTPAFTPFTVTDGTNSWTMTKDQVTPVSGGGECFEFGTDGATFTGTCGTGVGGPPNGAFALATLGGVVPTATGTYGLFGGGAFDFGPIGQDISNNLTGSLAISDVPEPTSILLLGSILGAVGWRLRRRAA